MEQNDRILHSYLRMTRQMSRQFRNYFSRLELTFPQALVLAALGEEGPMPLGRLAQYTGSANSTVSGIVDRLEKQKLVKRVRSRDDRRVIYVELTPEYAAAQAGKEPSVSAYLARLLEQMPVGEVERICDGLDKLSAALERADGT